VPSKQEVASGGLESTARYARVNVCGGAFVIAYTTTVTEDLMAVTVLTNGSTSSPQTVIASTLDDELLDSYSDVVNDRVLYATVDTSDNVRLARISVASGTITVTHSATPTTHTNPTGISIAQTSDGFVHVAAGDSTGYDVYRVSNDLTTLLTTSTPSGIASTTHTALGLGVDPTNNSGVVLTARTGTFQNPVLVYATLSSTHGAVSASAQRPGVQVLSKPFIDDNHAGVLVTAGKTSTDLGTVLLVRLPTTFTSVDNDYLEVGGVVAESGGRYLLGNEQAFALPSAPSHVRTTDSYGRTVTDWYFPYLRLYEQLGTAGTPNSLAERVFAARVARLRHASHEHAPRTLFGGVVYSAGSLLCGLTPGTWGETAPLLAPAAPDVGEVSAAGSMPAGTYAYRATYAYVDSTGRKWRGPVSPTTTLVKSSDASTTYVEAAVTAPLPTMRGNDVSGSWYYELYRTAVDGSVFRLAASIPVTPGQASADRNVDGESDADIADNLLLYTTGELEAHPPPTPSALVVHGNRMWLVDAHDRRRVWYSKELVEGYGPEFNVSLSFTCDRDVVALVSMDDKLVMLCADRTYVVVGDGLDATGGGTQFVPELVAPGVGCSGPFNAVATPIGVLTHDVSGFKLLGRDLQVTDASGAIGQRVTAAPKFIEHVPALQRVYVVLGAAADGSGDAATTYALDYARGATRWLVVTHGHGHNFHDLVWHGDRLRLLTLESNATTHQAYRDTVSANPHADYNGSTSIPVLPSVNVVNWRPPEAALVDQLRVRRMYVLVSVFSAASNNSAVTLDWLRQPGALSEIESASWAAADVEYLGSNLVTQLPVRPKHQRCYALSLTAAVASPAGDAGERGPRLHGLVVEWVPTGRTARPSNAARGAA
jgi:hypothetical protein